MPSRNQLDIISELFRKCSNTKLTIKNKDYQWNVFIGFCDTYGETPIPVSVNTLIRYCVYLIVQRNGSEGTVPIKSQATYTGSL